MAKMTVSFHIWSFFQEAWSQHHEKEFRGKFVWAFFWFSASCLLPCLGPTSCKYRSETGTTTFMWPGLCWYEIISLLCPSRLDRGFEKQELGKGIQIADSKWQQRALISCHWAQLDLNPLNQQHGRLKKIMTKNAKSRENKVLDGLWLGQRYNPTRSMCEVAVFLDFCFSITISTCGPRADYAVGMMPLPQGLNTWKQMQQYINAVEQAEIVKNGARTWPKSGSVEWSNASYRTPGIQLKMNRAGSSNQRAANLERSEGQSAVKARTQTSSSDSLPMCQFGW